MPDFPTSLGDFQRRYPDEAACAAWLFTTRWPAGFRCPACAHEKGWPHGGKPFTFECAACGKQTSVTAGTIMHGSKLPLTAWFWAAYLMATHSNGISALQLRNQLGLGSYKSAWLLCAKLRRAMVAPGRSALAGLAEVDETEILLRTKDDPVAGGGGRSHQGKMLVAGAVEVADGAPGRIRLAEITDFSAPSLHGFVAANVAPGTTIRTDGWSAYPGAPDVAHDPHVIGPMAAHVVLPWIHWVDPPRLLQPEDLGARRLPRSAQETPSGLSRRVRFPFQSPSHPPRRFPRAPRHRRCNQIRHLQNADPAGRRGISLYADS